MENKLFREKSMERVSSPEQLTDYIRVSNAGVWMILAAIIVLLAGVCIWGAFGKMETKLTVAAVSSNCQTICYVKEADISSVKKGMDVRCGENEYKVTQISTVPAVVDSSMNAYTLHLGNLQNGEWVYQVTFDGNEPDGIYQAEIITDSISPMSFVFN